MPMVTLSLGGVAIEIGHPTMTQTQLAERLISTWLLPELLQVRVVGESTPHREDPGLRGSRTPGETSITDTQPVSTSTEEFTIPQDIREAIRTTVATVQGSNPGEVLLRAWQEFLDRHRDVLDVDSKEVRRMLKENDQEGLAAYANRHNPERAKQAASRIKR